MEQNYDREEVAKVAKEDMNFFGAFCVPAIFKFFFPPIFIAIWGLMTEAVKKQTGLLQLAIGLPRGFAKTFVLKLFVVWCILFTDRKFILIVCNTEAKAINFIADVFDILDSINVKLVFGDWNLGKETDTKTMKKFGFRGRDVIVLGVGVGTSVRGINVKFSRPDIIILDDMQEREDAANPVIANQQLIWFLGTLWKARNAERCLFVFLGNMYPFEGCILRKLKHNPSWISFICGGILADGCSLWEDLRPLKDLLTELENDLTAGHPELFYSEVLNDEEAGTVSGIDVSKIPPFPVGLTENDSVAGCIIIDPASGKAQGDDVVVSLFLLFDGIPFLWKMVSGKLSPGDTIKEALRFALQYGIKVIAVESAAYQSTLLYWFEVIAQQLSISGIDFVELPPNNSRKNARIKDMLAQLLKGDIKLHPDVRSAVVHQITSWNPLKNTNVDDILDTLAYIYKAMELYGASMERAGFVNLTLDISPPAAFGEDLALSF